MFVCCWLHILCPTFTLIASLAESPGSQPAIYKACCHTRIMRLVCYMIASLAGALAHHVRKHTRIFPRAYEHPGNLLLNVDMLSGCGGKQALGVQQGELCAIWS
eukprot:gnl/MRDRNA2_/MRDRNA2_83293_c0_seq1.p1 gnl/MRDRNA2_/MRDRNA2_83293_c0~~gnl/MRDRNA2_/MRDRNA2_83293_c0_seq1.p1  ORF type:complete len:104 (+),score=2.96 gnl/MRDRNA2_/MRDRNA2_83293_c0_seq1:467-778(+)